MDNRSVRIAAVLASVAAVVSVVALLVTTYLSAKPQEVMTPEQTSVEGTPEPAGALRSPATSTAPVQGPAHDDEVAYVPDERTKAAILEVTVRFLTEWKRPGTPDERRERIRPYATEWLTSRLAETDPANLPVATMTGQPELVTATPYAAATRTRFDNGLAVRCNLVLDTTGWRVAEVLPDTGVPSPSASPAPTTTSTNAPQSATADGPSPDVTAPGWQAGQPLGTPARPPASVAPHTPAPTSRSTPRSEAP
ncbi:hypothetical protein [Thermasporomyces composti]|jgi:hypothetical protein|uniref:Uncharacterized protein n=1 Tax=Thermasporomyces composti TaxID=696763 RepID=A0A3D9V407_THECX|nr:hypothetical protein [Thermasporomyces composti]REF36552.1 hypothetical protein DFJ64_1965 [Thermasporomyces composti]